MINLPTSERIRWRIYIVISFSFYLKLDYWLILLYNIHIRYNINYFGGLSLALLKKNDLIQVRIEGMTAEGSGVARYDGLAVFVPNSAPGDFAEIVIIKVSKNYAVGKITRLMTPGSGRCEPDCPSYPKCGGCSFRHLDYSEECRIKLQRVNDAMKRIGGVSMEAEELMAAAQPERYRNKAQIPFGTGG